MNGPDQYREAEQHLRSAAANETASHTPPPGDRRRREIQLRDYHLAAAQVHATLALVAATAHTAAEDAHSNGRTAAGPVAARWAATIG